MKIKKHKLPNLNWVGRGLATKNMVPGVSVYGERLIKGLRAWDPKRSKLCAALMKNMKVPIREDDLWLYLGVSSGTTASHVSDMVTKGWIFGVDFAPRTMRDFYFLTKQRPNLIPILASANNPEDYSFVPKVDFVYQDVAQPNQSDILIKNCKYFLKDGGHALFMIKARSIDVRAKPRDVFKREEKKLVDAGFTIVDKKDLKPFEKDHMALLLKF